MPGRKAHPTALKLLRGNPGKGALPKPGEEPSPEAFVEVPEPPDWLGSYGVKEWERVAPVLLAQGLLTEADLLSFTAYCANVDILVTSVIDLEENGTTIIGGRGPVRNPALASFAQSTTALRALAAEFGMTPSSRARMRLPGDQGESLADLMGDVGGTEDAA